MGGGGGAGSIERGKLGLTFGFQKQEGRKPGRLFIHTPTPPPPAPTQTSGPSSHLYLFSPRKGIGQVLIITLLRALCPLSPSD